MKVFRPALMEATPLELLGTRQDADGGFPASIGLASSAESTALARLALLRAGGGGRRAEDARARSWLQERQRADGAWPLTDAVPAPSWATAWCLLALCDDRRSEASTDLRRAGEWLVGREGRRPGWLRLTLRRILAPDVHVRLDHGLRGWPWHSDAFSWVEPTAAAMLALKKLGEPVPGMEDRIAQGTELLLDRMCEGGGWNYGSPSVLDASLPPYPDQTALALIALQDSGAADAQERSLERLEEMLDHQGSALALAWGVLCLAVYGREVAEWQARLRKRLRDLPGSGETRTLALAALALGGGGQVFRL